MILLYSIIYYIIQSFNYITMVGSILRPKNKLENNLYIYINIIEL